MTSGILFNKHNEVNKNTRVTVWRFNSDHIHLEVDSDLCALAAVLRITCAEARVIGQALIQAADVVAPVEEADEVEA